MDASVFSSSSSSSSLQVQNLPLDWINAQEDEHKRLFEEFHFLSGITVYDHNTKMCSRNSFLRRHKMQRVDYENRVESLLNTFENADPVKMCMLSQYFVTHYDSQKLKKYRDNIKWCNHHIMVADGVEEIYVPDLIRRRFYVMDVVTNGLVLRHWREIFAQQIHHAPAVNPETRIETRPDVTTAVQGIPLQQEPASSFIASSISNSRGNNGSIAG